MLSHDLILYDSLSCSYTLLDNHTGYNFCIYKGNVKTYNILLGSWEITFNTNTKNIFFSSNECECPVARNKGPCKHKHAISQFFNVASFSVLPVYDANTRKIYHYIATGGRLDDHHYRGLQDTQEQVTCSTNDVDVASNQNEVDDSPDVATETLNLEENEMNHSNISRDRNSDEDDNFEMAWSEYLEDLKKLKQKCESNPNVKKSFLSSYQKKFHKAVNGNDNTLSRKLYDFGVEKNAFSISVLPTSTARRSKKNRGHEVSNMGRPHKQTKRKTQMFLGEGDGEKFHSLPTSSRRQGRQPHNLSAAVEA